MIAVEEQALLRLWAKLSGMSRGNVVLAWSDLTPEQRDALMDQARADLT